MKFLFCVVNNLKNYLLLFSLILLATNSLTKRCKNPTADIKRYLMPAVEKFKNQRVKQLPFLS